MKKLLVLILLIAGWVVWRYQSTHHPDLPGYQADAGEIQREHEKIYGQPLESSEIEKGFADAQNHIHRAEYHDAIVFFRSAAKMVAIPVFYNNLGVLYVATKDYPHAYSAFHQALDRDPAYQPAIDNLNQLGKGAEPETAQLETEPNESPGLANEIALNIPVSGEITAGKGDIDVFSFTTPSGPRDLLQVELENRAHFLEPRIRVLDSEGVLLNWDLKAEAGASMKQTITAKPNTLLYLELSGVNGTSGAYRLTVRPLKAFDAHEPNDTVFQSTPLEFGKELQANCMDGEDNDFYSILPPKSGEVIVDVQNQSTTLSPGVTLLSTDKTTVAFGPDMAPGKSVKMSMKVEGGHLYYVQVWPQLSTAGAYSITVTQP